MANNCLVDLKKEFPEVPEKTLGEIVNELDELRLESGSAVEYKKNARKLLARGRMDNAEAINQAKMNLLKEVRLRENFTSVKDRIKGDVSMYGKGILTGTSGAYKGSNFSIQANSITSQRRLQHAVIGDLAENNLLKVAKKGELDVEIGKYIHHKDMGTLDKINVSSQAKEIGETWYKANQMGLDLLQNSGSSVKKLLGRVIRRSHNMEKISKAGFDEWSTFMKKHYDVYKISKDPKKLEAALKDVYNELTSGAYTRRNISDLASREINMKTSNAFDKRVNQDRVFTALNDEADVLYNQKFGSGTLFESMMQMANNTSKVAAVMDKLGTEPLKTWEKLKAEIGKWAAENGQGQKWAVESGILDSHLDILMNGETPGINFTAKATALTSKAVDVAVLNKVSITAIPTDIMMSIRGIGKEQGVGLFASVGKMFDGLATNFSKADRKLIHDRVGTANDLDLGAHFSRVTTDDLPMGVASEVHNQFFKFTGLPWFTKWFKNSNHFIGMSWAGDNAGLKYTEVDPHFKRNVLDRYDINEADWDAIRQSTAQVKNTTVIDPQAILDADVKRFKNKAHQEELAQKIRVWLNDSTDSAKVYTPGMEQKWAFVQDTNPNTLAGATVRSMAKYKTFMTGIPSALNRQVMSDVAIEGATKTKADIGSTAATLGMSSIALLAAGFVSHYTSEVVDGKTPPDFWNAETWKRSAMRGGFFGLAGDALLGQYDKNYSSLEADILGPQMGAVSSLAELWAKTREGDVKSKDFMNRIMKLSPNLIGLGLLMDEVLVETVREMYDPAYEARRAKRLKETGQEEIFK